MVMRMAHLVGEKERDEAGCLQELRSMKWLSRWVLHRVKRGKFCMNIWLIEMKSSTLGFMEWVCCNCLEEGSDLKAGTIMALDK